MKRRRKALLAGIGGMTAALLGAICCVGTSLILALGVGSGLLSAVGPLRPLFGAAMVIFLAWGFYSMYLERRAVRCHVGEGADAATEIGEGRGRTHRFFFWVAVVVAVLLWSLPLILERAVHAH